MLQQFPIDEQFTNGEPCPPISCLRYSLVELLTKGEVILPSKLSGLGLAWRTNRTEKDLEKEECNLIEQDKLRK